MNNLDQNSNNTRLHTLLSDSRPRPELPPRFRENVWQRIEHGETPTAHPHWTETLAGWLLKPRYALAVITVLLLAGTLIGSFNGQSQARLLAQERYVATVVMPITH